MPSPVQLRPPRPEDRDALLALERASARFHATAGPGLRSPADFDAWLERSAAPDHEARLIRLRADDTIVGVANLGRIARGNFQSAYLGYRIHAPHAGRGYMTEALPLVLRLAFRELGLHRLEANILPGNAASIALVRRAGFRQEGFSPRYLKIRGRWRDHERWAILREEWEAGRAASPHRPSAGGSR